VAGRQHKVNHKVNHISTNKYYFEIKKSKVKVTKHNNSSMKFAVARERRLFAAPVRDLRIMNRPKLF